MADVGIPGARPGINMAGKKYGRLEVIRRDHLGERGWYWLFRCDCGGPKSMLVARGALVRSGKKSSCGCLRSENAATVGAATRRHGQSGDASGKNVTPEYRAWKNMMNRCYNPKNEKYRDYGGRGIEVCEEWKKSFEAFFRDMGPRPSPKHSIDREKNHLGYSPDNCRWVTMLEQANNRRGNLVFTYDGKTMTVAEWARYLGVSRGTLLARLKQELPDEEVFCGPDA